MTKYLFLLTIGPVQDFIAAARRTRDLWAGSKLLSELARTAAKTLRNEYKANLIFPAPSEENNDLEKHDVVNRILASVTTNDPMAIGHVIEYAIRQRLAAQTETSITAKTFDAIPGLTKSNLRYKAEAQVADLIEIYWAVVERTDDYNKDRTQVEAALAARKNTRDFVQPTKWASSVPKSSIDGLRESVISENEYPSGINDPKREHKIKQLFRNYGAKSAERLSGVDLLKRHYLHNTEHANFPSTSHFAALPLLNRFEKPFLDEAAKRWREYLAELERLGVDLNSLDRQRIRHPMIENYDASLLFEERLSDVIDDPQKLERAKHALRIFLLAFTNGKPPEPYYALLHGDGDFMGRTIDTLAEGEEGEKNHREFSQALDIFASNVRNIIEKDHLGALVYSGGDDVLALLPLHKVLPCAKALAHEFGERMGGFGDDVKPSFSIGIAICHHLEPLSDALELARNTEKIAKKVDGKNALAITLSKRGSGERTISGSWSKSGPSGAHDFYQRLLDLTEWHRNGAIPDSAAYDLHDLTNRLKNSLPPAAIKAEALRIVKRKRGHRGIAQKANNDLVALTEKLPHSAIATQEWSVAQFADELIITREFAKAQGYEVEQSKGVNA